MPEWIDEVDQIKVATELAVMELTYRMVPAHEARNRIESLIILKSQNQDWLRAKANVTWVLMALEKSGYKVVENV